MPPYVHPDGQLHLHAVAGSSESVKPSVGILGTSERENDEPLVEPDFGLPAPPHVAEIVAVPGDWAVFVPVRSHNPVAKFMLAVIVSSKYIVPDTVPTGINAPSAHAP